MDKSTNLVSSYYDTVANTFHEQYEREALTDPTKEYPAQYFRLQLLLNSFASKTLRRVVEIGVGEGTPLATLAGAGLEVWGCDISGHMVEKSQARMRSIGQDPDRIIRADIQDPVSYTTLLREGPFDGLLAMGVMPHVANEVAVLENMRTLVRPGGSVFIEFRNSLFSLFTLNRYTVDFIVNDLLRDVSSNVKDIVAQDLRSRLRVDRPRLRTTGANGDGPGYDSIVAKFHNPFEIREMFERNGFRDVKFMWYHYHAGMPYLEEKLAEEFRTEAVRLEHETSGWRGLFLCSAFVVEAIKDGGAQ